MHLSHWISLQINLLAWIKRLLFLLKNIFFKILTQISWKIRNESVDVSCYFLKIKADLYINLFYTLK